MQPYEVEVTLKLKVKLINLIITTEKIGWIWYHAVSGNRWMQGGEKALNQLNDKARQKIRYMKHEHAHGFE